MMDSRLKALASQDAEWTEIAEHEEQLEAILKRGFQDESDMTLVQKAVTLVLAEIAWRKAELPKLQTDTNCELVVGGVYQIAFTDSRQDPSTWFDGQATFAGLDPEDYGDTEKQHVHFEAEGYDGVMSFPLTAVGKRLN